MKQTIECIRIDSVVVFEEMPVEVCNDRTTSLRGRLSLVDIAVEVQLRQRLY